MERNLGFLTTYEIEYIYEFLGVDRINKKLEELDGAPTMGTTFNDFLARDPMFSFYPGKGKLYIFQLISDWFRTDLDLQIFLYKQSKNINHENYNEGRILKKLLKDYKKRLNKRLIENPEKKERYEIEKVNTYYKDYHFFITVLVKKLIMYKSDSEVNSMLIEIFEYYINVSGKITSQLKAVKFWPENGLGSGIFMSMEAFYEERNDLIKVKQIRSKARNQGWRPYIF